MENSIEEITFVENEIKNTKRLFEEVGCYAFFDEDLCKAIEYILSDYKRVLKDNEEKKENIDLICNQIIDLALLSNKELKPEELESFIQRSNKLMGMVISL